MTEMFGEAWSPMSVPDLAPDDDDDDLWVTGHVSVRGAGCCRVGDFHDDRKIRVFYFFIIIHYSIPHSSPCFEWPAHASFPCGFHCTVYRVIISFGSSSPIRLLFSASQFHDCRGWIYSSYRYLH